MTESPAKGTESQPVAARQIALFIACAAFAAAAFFGTQAYINYVGVGGRLLLARDYDVFHFASLLLWQGDFTTLFDPTKFMAAHAAAAQTEVGFSPFPYPPSALWAVAPLIVLPGMLGVLVWLGVLFALYAWPVCARAVRPRHAALALLLAPGSIVNILYGQNGFLSGALLAGGLLLLDRRPIVAGLLFGLLTFKPQFGLLLPFVLLAGGYYRTFLTAAAATVVLVLGSVLLLGTTPWLDYLNIAMPSQRAFLETGKGLAILTTPSVFMGARLIGLPSTLSYALQAVAALAVATGCILVFRRRAVAIEVKAALVMIGAFLVTPYCSSSDVTIVAGAQILIFASGGAWDSRAGLLHALVWALPVLMVLASLAHVPLAPLALGTLFVVLCRQAMRGRTDRIAVTGPSAP